MKIKIEQLRKEIMYCLVEQDYFDYERYEKKMKEWKGTFWGTMLEDQTIRQLRNKIDDVIGEITMDKETQQKMQEVEKLSNCKHRKDSYCKKIDHQIKGGYAILYHCKNCKYFAKGELEE